VSKVACLKQRRLTEGRKKNEQEQKRTAGQKIAWLRTGGPREEEATYFSETAEKQRGVSATRSLVSKRSDISELQKTGWW